MNFQSRTKNLGIWLVFPILIARTPPRFRFAPSRCRLHSYRIKRRDRTSCKQGSASPFLFCTHSLVVHVCELLRLVRCDTHTWLFHGVCTYIAMQNLWVYTYATLDARVYRYVAMSQAGAIHIRVYRKATNNMYVSQYFWFFFWPYSSCKLFIAYT